MAWLFGVLLTLLAVKAAPSPLCSKKPNIVYMLVDDLGWGDVGRHDPMMVTPAINRLAKSGRELYNHYALPVCAPTRAALMTAIYPYRYGFQENPVLWLERAWLNTSFTLLPEYLKNAGYNTHMVGKWHLGFCNWSMTPLRRGFETFYGFLKGSQGYYNHSDKNWWGYDFRDQYKLVENATVFGKFATKLHTNRAVKIIKGKDSSSKPFFLYMSYQSVHNPWEVKTYWRNKCSHTNKTRKLFCGMVAALDRSVRRIKKAVTELRDRQPDRCTLIVFVSDNGGDVHGGASNYPLRGRKGGMFEGGTKSYGIVNAPDLLNGPTDVPYKGLIHMVDWLPTLLEAAGAPIPEGLDGVPLWEEIRDNKVTKRSRESFIYNIIKDKSAARYKNFKLTYGYPTWFDSGWYPPSSMYNDTVKWEEFDHPMDGMQYKMLFDLEKDPAERVNLLLNITKMPDGDYKNAVLFAKNYTENLLKEQKKHVLPFVRQSYSNAAIALAMGQGFFSPSFEEVKSIKEEGKGEGWCDKP